MVDHANHGKISALTLAIIVGIHTPGVSAVTFDVEVDPFGLDREMYLDPVIEKGATVKVFLGGFKEVWLKALNHSGNSYRLRAADAIGRAYQVGRHEMVETIPHLMSMFRNRQEHRLVRVALARTLHRLNAKEAAPDLFEDIRGDDLDLILAADAALADWGYEPAAEVWITRSRSDSAGRRARISAIESLEVAGFKQAADRLLEIATDQRTPAPTRLAAARATAGLRREGLETVAGQLEGATIDQLVGVTLLRHHQSKAAQTRFMTLISDQDPTVVAVALRALLDIDPLLISPATENLVEHSDVHVRHLAAEGLLSEGNAKAVSLLGPLLNDPHPTLRRFVRDGLIQLGKQKGNQIVVIDETIRILAGDRWRGLEQAAIVLGRLDYKPASRRLVELMAFDRYEVRVSACVALRWLAIPEHAPAIHEQAKLAIDRWNGDVALFAKRGESPDKEIPITDYLPDADDDEEVSQLLQTLGAMNYGLAELMMPPFIPKPGDPLGFGSKSRSGAIWSLGHFFNDQPDNPYVDAIAERLADVNPFNPERPDVRRMSAISLGRMRASQHVPTLRRFFEMEPGSGVGGACRWAIMRITGEILPGPPASKEGTRPFFLEPLP